MDTGRDPGRRRHQPLLNLNGPKLFLPAAVLAAVFLTAVPAPADVVRLRSGRTLTGTVTDTEADPLELRLTNGAVKLDRSLVEWVVPGDPGRIEAQRRAGGYFDRARALMAGHRFTEAADAYRQALKLVPGDANLLNNLGSAQASAGDRTGAVGAYEEALRSDPAHATARLNLAQVFLEAGEPAKARQQLEILAAAAPDDPDLLFRLGVALCREGLYNKAVETYTRLLELEPTADAYNNLGTCRAGAGDRAGAAAAYEEALRLDPSHDQARSNLEKLPDAPSN